MSRDRINIAGVVALLTCFLFFIELSFFIQSNSFFLTDYFYISNHLSFPLPVFPIVSFFIVTQLIIHAAFWGVMCLAAIICIRYFNISANKQWECAIIVWLLGVITCLLANLYFYPNSSYSKLLALLVSRSTAKICLIGLLIGWAGIFSIPLVNKKWMRWSVIAIGGIMGAMMLIPPRVIHDAATQERPNIIIIGVDSLRPDFLGYFGNDNVTPFFDVFLSQATVFAEAITPSARTFPSWTGILTGESPKKVGVRYNLANLDSIRLTNSLPIFLRQQGYHSIYATDEVRFSNIDQRYGFDRVVSPPMGINDFVYGTINDFPLSNLLVNTIIGRWLFPYSYANRPVYITYEPNSFLKMVAPYLQTDRTQPLFLAIHFCLTHGPYLWADLPEEGNNPIQRYAKSIGRVDQQLQDFMMLLKQANLLEHAIVVLLSDHGEALELSGDRITEADLYTRSAHDKSPIPKFYPPSLDNLGINQTVGHGTDVLGLPQYHTLLAWKLYGLSNQYNGVIPGMVSLLDIEPTIRELISGKQIQHSLLPYILGKSKVVQPRHLFIESDFTPEAIQTVYPEMRKVLFDNIHYYQVDQKTGRVTFSDDMGPKIIHSKQFADIYGEWVLASYPQDQRKRISVLINLSSGQWTDDMRSSFAQSAPLQLMQEAMQKYFGDELVDNFLHDS